MADKLFNGFKQKANELSDTNKLLCLLVEYIKEKYGWHHYAKCSSLLVEMTHDYDALLNEFDVMIMPTLTYLPCKIPSKDATITEKIEKAFGMIGNTGIFDATGHPALSLNCGYHNEFPVGLMIVGKHFDELKVLSVASMFEETFGEQLKK